MANRKISELTGVTNPTDLLTVAGGDTRYARVGLAQVSWGNILGSLSAQTDLVTALAAKASNTTFGVGANGLVPGPGSVAGKFLRDDGTWQVASGSGGGAWGSIAGTLSSQTDLQTALNAKEGTITAGTTSQYWRGDKTWQTLNAAAVGLGNVSNATQQPIHVNLTALSNLTMAGNAGLVVKVNGTGTGFVLSPDLQGTTAAWGGITGTLSSQTDLQTALNGKLGFTDNTVAYGPGAVSLIPDATYGTSCLSVGDVTQMSMATMNSGVAADHAGAGFSIDLQNWVGGGAMGGLSARNRIRFNQYGSVLGFEFDATPYVGANAIYHAGNLTASTLGITGTNTGDETYSTITTKLAGGSGGGTTNFLRADGTFAAPATGGTWGSITGTLSAQSDLNTALSGKEASITAGTTAQYWRGDKSWQTLDKTAVGLSNVTNVAQQPSSGDLTAIAALAGTSGLLKKTAANTWALDTTSYLTANQTITFTGDATGSGSTSVALTIANGAVTLAKMQTLGANVILGNNGGTGQAVAQLSISTVTAMLNAMTGAGASTAGVQGMVPAPSAGDNTKFLRGDGSWVAQTALTTISNNTILGNISGSTAAASGLTGSQVTALLSGFGGATGIAAGTKGIVPAPAAGDQQKLLRGDGTWHTFVWGDLTGSISNQSDLSSALANKLDTTHAGTGGSSHATVISGGAAGFMLGSDKAKLDAITGTNTGDQDLSSLAPKASPTFTGTVNAATITATGNVTGANLSGTNTGDQYTSIGAQTILGNNTVASGAATALTSAQATALLTTMTGADGTSAGIKGLVPQPAATANTKFLRGDGTWALPAGSGGGTWGSITGLLSDQTDLQSALNALAPQGDITSAGLTLASAGVVGATAAGAAAVFSFAGLTANLTTFGASLKGLVPSPGASPDGLKFLRNDGTWVTPSGGTGTVTSVSVTTANGVSGTVATSTTTPAITLTLGAITPSSVAATGTVTGSNLSGTHSGTSSGTNTGDQTITLTGDVTGTGTGSFATTIGANKVTRSMLAATSGAALLGATSSGNVSDLTGTQATALLDTFTTSLKGLVPAPATSTGAFLKDDGTWAVPSCFVKLATTANFANTSPTATVLTATATGTTTFDGTALAANDRVLLKDQTNAQENGVYKVTTAGTTGVATVLTRVAELDTWAEIANSPRLVVQQGTANADSYWLCTADSGGTLGTTAINFKCVSNSAFTITTSGVSTTGTLAATGAVSGSNLSGTNTGDQDLSGLQPKATQLTNFAAASWSAGTQVVTLTAANTITLKTVGSATGNILDKAAGDALYAPISGSANYQAASSNLTAYAGAAWSAGVQVPTLTAANTVALKTVGSASGNLLDKASGDTLYKPITPGVYTNSTATGAVSIDATGYDEFRITVTGTITGITFTNLVSGKKYAFHMIQDGTGSHPVTLGTTWKFGTDVTAYTATTTASKRDLIGAWSDGTNLYVVGIAKGY